MTGPAAPIRRPGWRRAGRLGLRSAVVLLVGIPLFMLAAGGAAVGLLLYGDLPGTVPEENDRVVAVPSTVVDAAGNEIATFREFELTVPVEPGDIPQVLKDAVVAAEDQNFWEHNGVDLEGVSRAVWVNYRSGEVVQGGSTITQQLVKNRYLTSERSLSRKLEEAILATRLERELTKEEILFEYLDTTYFGAGAYGVGAAAQTYFRKPVADLTASESAILAGIIPAPSETNPRQNPFGAEDRRRNVIEAMGGLDMLSEDEVAAELAQELWYSGFGEPDRPATVYHPAEDTAAGRYPFFTDYLRQYLVERYGAEQVFRGGLRIEATIDPTLQASAETAIAAKLEGVEPPVEMSLVSVDPSTGFVRALIGGRDWDASQVNLALGGTLGMQPGSSFKPFVLAAALEQGIEPDTAYPAPGVWAVPGCVGDQCTIKNYSGRSYGSMTLAAATRSSVNTVYGELIFDVGSAAVVDTATRLGISSLDQDREYGVSLALGAAEVSPLDMASAYGVFANSGVRVAPTPVVRVTDADGNVLEDHSIVSGAQVLHPAVADTVTEILTGVVERGTGTGAQIGRPVAGKTGTAEEYRAAWFVGYTPQLSTAVWMGHADAPAPLRNIGGYSTVTGGSIPASAWAAYMTGATEGVPVLEFPEPGALPVPGGEVTIEVDKRRQPTEIGGGCGGLCDEPIADSTTRPITTDTSSAGDEPEGAGTADSESDDESEASDPDGTDPDQTTEEPSETTTETTVGVDYD